MPVDNMPRSTAEAKRQTLTLGELRELVEAAAPYPPETIVRGRMVPFKRSDLGHPKGGSLTAIALDRPESWVSSE